MITIFPPTANPRKVRVEDNRGLKIEVKFDKLKGSSEAAADDSATDKPREERKEEPKTSSAPNPNAPAFQPTPIVSQSSHWEQQQQQQQQLQIGTWTADQG